MTASEEWVQRERAKVIMHLATHDDRHGPVAAWPDFECEPFVAIWAIESSEQDHRTAFWAFSGDMPTDIVGRNWADPEDNARKALVRILTHWASYVPYLELGTNPPEMLGHGDADDLRKRVEPYRARIKILTEWAEDDELWDDDCPLDT